MKRIYPKELQAILRKKWDGEPFFESWPRVDLPEKRLLEELLDVCYHASMQSEESRPVVFRIIFIGRTASGFPKRDDNVIDSITRYYFEQPVPFSEGELRRLAPVADPRSVLIAVEQAGEGNEARLHFYGLVDVGLSLWEMARHERHGGYASPEALIIGSTRPGELSIARGHRPVMRLRDGQIIEATDAVMYEGPISDFFFDANTRLELLAHKLVGIDEEYDREANEVEPEDQESFLTHYACFVESLLLYTADMKHGGTLLFVPDELTHEDPRLLNRLSIKYIMPSTRPRDALVTMMGAKLIHSVAASEIDKKRTIKRKDIQFVENAAQEHIRTNDCVKDAARFIASLTAVDGAVVLTDTLRLIGFGAEVLVHSPSLNHVHIAKDAQGNESIAVPFSSFGTRHRSAFRFASNMEPSVAFVMSQDGGIKAIRQVGSRLLMWPYFKIGFTTAMA